MIFYQAGKWFNEEKLAQWPSTLTQEECFKYAVKFCKSECGYRAASAIWLRRMGPAVLVMIPAHATLARLNSTVTFFPVGEQANT